MIDHLITLLWNRKRANGLLIAEILLAFAVLFAVSSLGLYLHRNYQAPLGFAYDHVWRVGLSSGTQPPGEVLGTLQRVLQRLRSTPGVVAVARSSGNTPFASNQSSGEINSGPGTLEVHSDFYNVSAELRDVMGLELKEGRWFDRRDDVVARRPPVVITEATRAALFPDGQSALGKVVRIGFKGDEEHIIVGVSGPYRSGGEFSVPQPGVFRYVSPQDTARGLSTLLVRVQPGRGVALEKQLRDDIRAIAPDWTSDIERLPEMRLRRLKAELAPPLLLGIVCLFLIINVALGLFGVLWLNISQRRAEIGVRRAMGATAGDVSGQIVGEVVVVATFGLVPGLLLAAQFPLLGVLDVPAGVYLTAMALATALIYGLTMLCALYPSRLAAGIHPAVALREE